MSGCNACPRRCGVDRTTAVGACGVGAAFRVARMALHAWEESCISGKSGSGAIFFSGCPLKCVFCQNMEISRGCKGVDLTEDQLIAGMCRKCGCYVEVRAALKDSTCPHTEGRMW